MWYLVLSKREASMDEIRSRTADHFVWMKRQHQAGNVLFSGPTPDRTMGIYVVRADSLRTAQELVDSDPFHMHGLRDYEIIEWEVHQALGVGPFDLESIHFLAQRQQDGSYTPLPVE